MCPSCRWLADTCRSCVSCPRAPIHTSHTNTTLIVSKAVWFLLTVSTPSTAHSFACTGNGFTTIIHGVGVRVYARGVWFPLDTPMRTKFWLLARPSACNLCIKRSFSSAFLVGRPNSTAQVRQLYADVISEQRRVDANEPNADADLKRARRRMKRHGHHPVEHCLWELQHHRYGGLLVLHPAHGTQGLDTQGDYLHRILLNICGVYFIGDVNAILSSLSGGIEKLNKILREVPKQRDRHGGVAMRKCPVHSATRPTAPGRGKSKGGAKSAQHIKEVAFLYVYGLGSNAGIIRANTGGKLFNANACADAVLEAASLLQVIVLSHSPSARRRYTSTELDLAFRELPNRVFRALERARFYHKGPRGAEGVNADLSCSTSDAVETRGDVPRNARCYEYPSAHRALTHSSHYANIVRDTGCTTMADTTGCERDHPVSVRDPAERTKAETPLKKYERMYDLQSRWGVVREIHELCGPFENTARFRYSVGVVCYACTYTRAHLSIIFQMDTCGHVSPSSPLADTCGCMCRKHTFWTYARHHQPPCITLCVARPHELLVQVHGPDQTSFGRTRQAHGLRRLPVLNCARPWR